MVEGTDGLPVTSSEMDLNTSETLFEGQNGENGKPGEAVKL